MKFKKHRLIIGIVICFNFGQLKAQNEYLNLKAKLSEKKIAEFLQVISSDSFEGRGSGTAGEKKTLTYLTTMYKQFNLIPGNNKSYLQPFTLLSYKTSSADLSINGKSLSFIQDFNIDSRFPAQGPVNENSVIFFLKKQILDTSYLNGIKNRIILIKNQPVNNSLYTFINFLQRKGARGCINLIDDKINTSPTYVLANKTEPFFLLYLKTSAISFQELLAKNKILNEEFPVEVPLHFVLQAVVESSNIDCNNVIGAIRGKKYPNEYVIITAHLDHLGIKNGEIYNGADDDGSGLASLLEIARVFSELKTSGITADRTVVFLANSAEELGLFGSYYYSINPLFPLAKTSVDLNIDMIGRADPEYKGNPNNYLYIIGDDRLSSRLVKIVDTINNSFINLELDRKFNDPNDPNRLYYRSDHFNFAKNGVPSLFFFGGIHEDYHKPSDKIDKINFPLLTLRTQLIILTAWKIANEASLLTRDIPLYNK